MSDADSRRQKNTTRSTSRFEIREPTKPKPPQLRPLLDLDEGFPELRPRRSHVNSSNLANAQSVHYDDEVPATRAETRALGKTGKLARDVNASSYRDYPASDEPAVRSGSTSRQMAAYHPDDEYAYDEPAPRARTGNTGRHTAAQYIEDDYEYEQPAPRARSGNTGRHTAAYNYDEPAPRARTGNTGRHSAAYEYDEPAPRTKTGSTVRLKAAYAEPEYDYEPIRPFGSQASAGPSVLSFDDQPSLVQRLFGNPLMMLMVAGCCLLVYLALSKPANVTFSNYSAQILSGGSAILQPAVPAVDIPYTPPGEHTVMGAPTLSPSDIDAILRQFGSPAVGTGQDWYDLGIKYSIDPAYAVAFFIHESSAGTNPAWAGMKSDGSTTHNVGNIICAGYPTCYGRFRDYESWYVGIEDWYKLISREYIRDREAHTVEQIIPIYAPSFENDVQQYVNVVVQMVENWRRNGVN